MVLNMRGISGREAEGINCFDLRLVLGKTPELCWGEMFQKKDRFCCLDLLLPSELSDRRVSASSRGGFETWGQPPAAAGAMRRSRLAFLAQTKVVCKSRRVLPL